jgi:hypothetical protein
MKAEFRLVLVGFGEILEVFVRVSPCKHLARTQLESTKNALQSLLL